jgi:hypothetical protein
VPAWLLLDRNTVVCWRWKLLGTLECHEHKLCANHRAAWQQSTHCTSCAGTPACTAAWQGTFTLSALPTTNCMAPALLVNTGVVIAIFSPLELALPNM